MKDNLKYLRTGLSAFETLELSSTTKLLEQMNSLSIRSQLDEVTKYQRLMDDVRKSINPFSDAITEMARQQEQYRKALEPLRLSIETHQDSIRKALEPAISFQKTVNELVQPILRQQDEIKRLLEPFAETQRLALSFAEQIKVPLIRDFVDPFRKVMDSIPPEMWVRVRLSSGFWVIEDEEIIAHLTENRHSGINQEEYICEYYSADGWRKLGLIVEKWAECKAIKHRYPILKDCFETLKLAQDKDINIANVIIPTLIAQIEGLKREILEIPSEEFKAQIQTQLGVSLVPANGKQSKKAKSDERELLQFLIAEHLSESCAFTFYEIIGELFKNSYDFTKEKENGDNVINLNRHKIQHGDRILLDYGSEENLVRLFLYIDFMIKIIAGMQNALCRQSDEVMEVAE